MIGNTTKKATTPTNVRKAMSVAPAEGGEPTVREEDHRSHGEERERPERGADFAEILLTDACGGASGRVATARPRVDPYRIVVPGRHTPSCLLT